MQQITHYVYATSPYAAKVHCYLLYKRLTFKTVHVEPVFRGEIAFTKQKVVPVLKIDSEWRSDSTQIGMWLEELFPDRPYLGSSEKERKEILKYDTWVSDTVIASIMRMLVDWEGFADAVYNGHCLSSTLNAARPLPWPLRKSWPLILKCTPFVRRDAAKTNRTETRAEMRARITEEFYGLLGDGPFLGGRSTISMADLSLFPQLVMYPMFGMRNFGTLNLEPKVLEWTGRMQEAIGGHPLIAEREVCVCSFPGLA